MKSNRSAFTIVEMLVSMIIAAVILALAWNVVFFLDKYKNRIGLKSEAFSEVKRLEYYLVNDFNTSVMVYLEKDQLSLFKKRDTIIYYFDKGQTIRRLDKTSDTLKIETLMIRKAPEEFQVCFDHSGYCFFLKKNNAGDLLYNRTAVK